MLQRAYVAGTYRRSSINYSRSFAEGPAETPVVLPLRAFSAAAAAPVAGPSAAAVEAVAVAPQTVEFHDATDGSQLQPDASSDAAEESNSKPVAVASPAMLLMPSYSGGHTDSQKPRDSEFTLGSPESTHPAELAPASSESVYLPESTQNTESTQVTRQETSELPQVAPDSNSAKAPAQAQLTDIPAEVDSHAPTSSVSHADAASVPVEQAADSTDLLDADYYHQPALKSELADNMPVAAAPVHNITPPADEGGESHTFDSLVQSEMDSSADEYQSAGSDSAQEEESLLSLEYGDLSQPAAQQSKSAESAKGTQPAGSPDAANTDEHVETAEIPLTAEPAEPIGTVEAVNSAERAQLTEPAVMAEADDSAEQAGVVTEMVSPDASYDSHHDAMSIVPEVEHDTYAAHSHGQDVNEALTVAEEPAESAVLPEHIEQAPSAVLPAHVEQAGSAAQDKLLNHADAAPAVQYHTGDMPIVDGAASVSGEASIFREVPGQHPQLPVPRQLPVIHSLKVLSANALGLAGTVAGELAGTVAGVMAGAVVGSAVGGGSLVKHTMVALQQDGVTVAKKLAAETGKGGYVGVGASPAEHRKHASSGLPAATTATDIQKAGVQPGEVARSVQESAAPAAYHAVRALAQNDIADTAQHKMIDAHKPTATDQPLAGAASKDTLYGNVAKPRYFDEIPDLHLVVSDALGNFFGDDVAVDDVAHDKQPELAGEISHLKPNATEYAEPPHKPMQLNDAVEHNDIPQKPYEANAAAAAVQDSPVTSLSSSEPVVEPVRETPPADLPVMPTAVATAAGAGSAVVLAAHAEEQQQMSADVGITVEDAAAQEHQPQEQPQLQQQDLFSSGYVSNHFGDVDTGAMVTGDTGVDDNVANDTVADGTIVGGPTVDDMVSESIVVVDTGADDGDKNNSDAGGDVDAGADSGGYGPGADGADVYDGAPADSGEHTGQVVAVANPLTAVTAVDAPNNTVSPFEHHADMPPAGLPVMPTAVATAAGAVAGAAAGAAAGAGAAVALAAHAQEQQKMSAVSGIADEDATEEHQPQELWQQQQQAPVKNLPSSGDVTNHACAGASITEDTGADENVPDDGIAVAEDDIVGGITVDDTVPDSIVVVDIGADDDRDKKRSDAGGYGDAAADGGDGADGADVDHGAPADSGENTGQVVAATNPLTAITAVDAPDNTVSPFEDYAAAAATATTAATAAAVASKDTDDEDDDDLEALIAPTAVTVPRPPIRRSLSASALYAVKRFSESPLSVGGWARSSSQTYDQLVNGRGQSMPADDMTDYMLSRQQRLQLLTGAAVATAAVTAAVSMVALRRSPSNA